MPDYYLARQRLEYALQDLDGDGTVHERLTNAWMRLTDLGTGDVTIPLSIAEGVGEMHRQVATWLLPRQTGALGRTVSWMDDEECQAASDQIRSWRRAVDEAIAQGSGLQ